VIAQPQGSPRRPTLAVLALVFNALVWGVSWWPFRRLEAAGLHPLWTTVLIFCLAAAAIVAARPHALGQVARTPALWVLLLAAGTTNAAFNWAVVVGDVVRVVLLFYLMPLWALVFARVLLGERFTSAAWLRVALALGGAVAVLWPASDAVRLQFGLAEALGLLGGLSFALNNVMLRREWQRSGESRALAMFLGGVVVAGGAAAALAAVGHVRWPPPPTAGWVVLAIALGMIFLLSNLALQFGAAALPAGVTAVIMLMEVLFATVSAVWLGGGSLTVQAAIGGGLIIVAALLATRGTRAGA
jgi:drug/metabolite transporter (DMT)-like permease